IVAVSDFSGLTSSAWAFAKAEARAATDSLDRCTACFRFQDIKAHCAGSGALSAHPVSDRLLGVLGNERLKLTFRPFVIEEGATGIAKQRRELGPGVRGTHVDNADRLDTSSRRLGIDEVGSLAGLDAPPEFLFGRYQNSQIERVHGDGDLDPLAAAGD